MPNSSARLAAAAFALAACADPVSTPRRAGGAVAMSVQAAVSAGIAGITAEVTGPGITNPITANLAVNASGVASGTMQVPVGPQRTFTLYAFDAQARQTHQGSRTIDIAPGQNVVLDVTLVPLTAGVPIQATIGTYTVTVSPALVMVDLLGTTTFIASVTDVTGATVATSAGDPTSFSWAAFNPVIASVDGAGTATGHVSGMTRVVANYLVGGFSASASVAVLPGSSTELVSLSAGAFQTCAISSGLQLYCWGANSYGQLGRGTTSTGESTPATVSVTGQQDFIAVAAGSGHTCALRVGGTLMCWGFNSVAEPLGIDPSSDKRLPQPVIQPAGVTFKAVTAGMGFTCALATTGAAYCWGANDEGELGVPGTIAVPSIPIPGLTFSQIDAGGFHACGVTAAPSPAGDVYCWGENVAGQLGDGTTALRSAPVAAQAPSGVKFRRVSAGWRTTCALATTGDAYCWGTANGVGLLGNGLNADAAQPTLVPAGLTFASISVSVTSACARTAAGALYCWGENDLIGVPTPVGGLHMSLTPTLVPGIGSVQALGTGNAHTCVTAAGVVQCAGLNSAGYLGDGTGNFRVPFAPILAPAGVGFRAP